MDKLINKWHWGTITFYKRDSIHAKLKTHYEVWSYKRMEEKKIKRKQEKLFKKNLKIKDVY